MGCLCLNSNALHVCLYMFSRMGTNIQKIQTLFIEELKRANTCTCISEKISQTSFLSLLVFYSWALFLSERNSIYYTIIVLYIVYNH